MRISDWSSDVCSSDLLIDADCAIYAMTARYEPLRTRLTACAPGDVAISAISFAEIALGNEQGRPPLPEVLEAFLAAIPLVPFDESAARAYSKLRSEEHTSELQSLMRISYAVFCLTKKNRTTDIQ